MTQKNQITAREIAIAPYIVTKYDKKIKCLFHSVVCFSGASFKA